MSCFRVMACIVARVLESSELQSEVTVGIGVETEDRGLAASLPSTTLHSASLTALTLRATRAAL